MQNQNIFISKLRVPPILPQPDGWHPDGNSEDHRAVRKVAGTQSCPGARSEWSLKVGATTRHPKCHCIRRHHLAFSQLICLFTASLNCLGMWLSMQIADRKRWEPGLVREQTHSLKREHSFQRWSFQGAVVLGHLGAASDQGSWRGCWPYAGPW